MNTTNATLATAFTWLVAAMTIPEFFGFSIFMACFMIVMYVVFKHLDLERSSK